MSSGIKVNKECVDCYDKIKLKHEHRYAIFHIDNNEIVIKKIGEKQATYDDFVGELKEAEANSQCRYGLFDAGFELESGQKREKLLFFYWAPEAATVKQKMVYSASKQYIIKALVGVSKVIQANDDSDLDWGDIMKNLLRSEAAS